jgi:hypothetical protein
MLIERQRVASCRHTALRNLSLSVDHSFQLSSCMCGAVWLQRVAYLADMFTKVKELNLLFQSSTIIII